LQSPPDFFKKEQHTRTAGCATEFQPTLFRNQFLPMTTAFASAFSDSGSIFIHASDDSDPQKKQAFKRKFKKLKSAGKRKREFEPCPQTTAHSFESAQEASRRKTGCCSGRKHSLVSSPGRDSRGDTLSSVVSPVSSRSSPRLVGLEQSLNKGHAPKFRNVHKRRRKGISYQGDPCHAATKESNVRDMGQTSDDTDSEDTSCPSPQSSTQTVLPNFDDSLDDLSSSEDCEHPFARSLSKHCSSRKYLRGEPATSWKGRRNVSIHNQATTAGEPFESVYGTLLGSTTVYQRRCSKLKEPESTVPLVLPQNPCLPSETQPTHTDVPEPSKPGVDVQTLSEKREALLFAETEKEDKASIDLERIPPPLLDPDNLCQRATEYVPPYNSEWWLYLMSIMDHENPADTTCDNRPTVSIPSNRTIPEHKKRPGSKEEQASQKTLTHVGKSRQPYRCVHLHNQRLVSSKSTRGAAGLWSIELVIGPFATKSQTFPLRDLWKSKTRGPVSRRAFGKWLAAELGVECYDSKFGKDDSYADTWKESRMERRRVRCASKAASYNAVFMRRQTPRLVFDHQPETTGLV